MSAPSPPPFFGEHPHYSMLRGFGRCDGTTEISVHELKAINYLADLKGLVRRIAKGKEEACFSKNIFGMLRYGTTRFGHRVWLACRTYQTYREFFEGRTFDPHLTLFFEEASKADLVLRHCIRMGEADVDVDAVREALEGMVDSIRATCSSDAFRRKVNNYERNAQCNFKSCCDYVADLFAMKSCLLIVRVDLYY